MHASSADSGATRFPLRPRLLLPRPDARAVLRPRLMRRIAADRVSPVTAIVAPAGFGKTTLAAQWLAGRESPSAWITLEPDDDSPARCLYALVAALRRIDPTVGTASLAIIAAEPPPAPDQVGEALADELRRVASPWTLVIDDAHVLADPDSHALLAGLLRTPLPAGHVLLTSRTPLPPAICQAIGADRLVQLDATDLRFADDETRDLAIAIVGNDPGPATLDRLREVASGWAACARLLLGRLRDAAPGDPLAIGHDADVDGVVDWLIARSLDHLPAAVRDALHVGALSPIVCDDLLAALLPAQPAPVRLAAIAGDEVLLTLLGEGWWRYHPLVRGALLRRLGREQSVADRAAAHRRASAWFAARDMLPEAVHHALAAEEPALAASLVQDAGFAALAADRWDLLAEALELLPERVERQHPGVLVLCCWRDYHRRVFPDRDDLDRAAVLLATPAGALVPALHARLVAHVDAWTTLLAFDPADIPGFLGGMGAAAARLRATDPGPCGIVAGLTGMLAGMADGAADGLGFLDERLAAASPAEAAHLLGARGWLLEVIAGDPVAAADALVAARAAAEGAGLPGAAAFAATRLGWLAVRRIDLPAAAAAFAAASRHEALQAINTWRMLASGRAMVALLGGDGETASAIAADSLGVSLRIRHPGTIENSRAFQARVWMMQRQIDLVEEWRATIAMAIDDETPLLPEAIGITWIRALLLFPTADRLAVADGLIDRMLAIAAANRLPLVTDAALLCRVAWLLASDRPSAARRLLRPIVERAAGRDDLLLLVEQAPPLRPLLRDIRWKPGVRGFVDRICSTLEPLAARWPDPGVFTPRQRDVLALLVAGKSFEEIAAALFLTPGTIRFHASGIYGLLGVDGFREVAERARALGLIPPA